MLIYVLKLENEKYYVGKTKKTIGEKFKEHMSGVGVIFTKTYKPIYVVECFESRDNYDEDKHTLKMMEKYGIDRVRGGSFVNEILSDEEKNLIKKMIKNANSKRFKYGIPYHFANKCRVKIKNAIDNISRSNWSNEEEQQIRKLFVDENKNIIEISKIQKRTPLSILIRLQKMHLLQNPIQEKETIVETITELIKKPVPTLKV